MAAAVIDDLTLKGPLSEVMKIFAEIKHVLHEDAGLELAVKKTQIFSKDMSSLPHGIAQGVALVLDCGWIKGLGRLFLQLLPLVLPINT